MAHKRNVAFGFGSFCTYSKHVSHVLSFVSTFILNIWHFNFIFRKSLQFYRGKDCDISVEFNEILKQNAEKASKAKGWRSTIKRIASPAFGRPFKCVGVLLLVFIATFILKANVSESLSDLQKKINFIVVKRSSFLKQWQHKNEC